MRSVLFFALFALLVSPFVSRAQTSAFGDLTSSDPFTVSVSPAYPAPGSDAILSFVSSTLNLTSATLAVSIGGKEIYRGSVQSVRVPLGKAGTIASVVATVSTGGNSYSRTVSIQPQDVILIAEPFASAAPLYKGKPVVPLEGNVRVIAVANLKTAGGKAIDPKTLSYAWTVDGASIANASGIGKSSLVVASPLQYRAREVSALVATLDGSLVGGASLTLSPLDPIVRVYENDPLLGIRFERALTATFELTNSETALYAAPFAFTTTMGPAVVQWYLNGEMAEVGPAITLRPAGDGEGSASLSLVASVGSYVKATSNLSLLFGASRKSSFFGL